MSMMTVSIIIPIYKVEPYILRCVDSVLCQTYRQLEIILVNDCSPDRSMEMAIEHIEASPQSKDLSFIYLSHEKNLGQAAARNTGLNVAKGEYIYFLDSDDEITEDCIEILTNEIKEHQGIEIVCGNSKEPYEGKQRVYHIEDYRYYDKNEHIRYCLFCPQQRIPITPWNKLVNLQFIKKNHLYFGKGLVAEDILWTFQVALKNKSLVMLPHITYIYNLNPNSTVVTTSMIKSCRSMAYNLGVIADSIDEPYCLLGLYKYLLRWFNIYKHLPTSENQPTSMKFCRTLWRHGERKTAIITWLYFRLYKMLRLGRIEWRLVNYTRRKYLYQDSLVKRNK